MSLADSTAPKRQRGRPRLDPAPPVPRLPPAFAAELEAYEPALDRYLTAMLTRTAPRRGFPDPRPLFASTARARAAFIVAHPDASPPALAVRQLGERVHAIGGVDAMEAVVERVARADPARCVTRAALLRSLWHGLGGEFWA